MGHPALTYADISRALGVPVRTAKSWLKDAPYRAAPPDGRGRPPRAFTLAEVVTMLRTGRRIGGLSSAEAAKLVAVGGLSDPTAAGDANLRVGDPAAFLAVLLPEEAERARKLITLARRGLVVGFWGKLTPELEAASWRVVMHPAGLAYVLAGDESALPQADQWPAFMHAFCRANGGGRETLHFNSLESAHV